MCRSLLVLLTIFLSFCSPTRAQDAGDVTGTALLTGWPQGSPGAFFDASGYDVLPFVDSLRLDYRYARHGRAPRLALALSWRAGARGVLDGVIVAAEALPEDVRMVAVSLMADVYVEERRTAQLAVTVDSMALAAGQEPAQITLPDLAWGDVFVDTPPAQARALFADGFVLRDLRMEQVAFAVYREHREDVAEDDAYPGDDLPSPTIYRSDVHVDLRFALDWLFAPRRGAYAGRRDGDGHRRTSARGALAGGRAAERGRQTGSGEARPAADEDTGRRGRSVRSGRSKNDDDEDDDDDNDLLPAALTAAAAVGIVAYAGGTIGYFGTEAAPIGLASGFVRRRGGMLLQASVDDALIAGDEGPKHFAAWVTGFPRVLRGPLQPAVGAGIRAVDDGDVTWNAGVAVGGVLLVGPVAFHAGYDLANGETMFGVAVTFRRIE